MHEACDSEKIPNLFKQVLIRPKYSKLSQNEKEKGKINKKKERERKRNWHMQKLIAGSLLNTRKM